MRSHPLTRLAFDGDLVRKEIEAIDRAQFGDAYSGFAVGSWRTCALWNRSGRAMDGVIEEYEGCAVPTEIGERTSAVNSLIATNFDVARLKAARLFSVEDGGLVMPHCDFLEFERGFHRLNIPLMTTPDALNVEEAVAYQMQSGEVWYVDVHRAHTAGVLSGSRRVHLVLDFDPRGEIAPIFFCRTSSDMYPRPPS